MKYSLLSQFVAETRGTMAIGFAVGSMVVLGAVGAAIDYSKSVSLNIKSQDFADVAVLAAAKHMRDKMTENPNFDRKLAQKSAENVGNALIEDYMSRDTFLRARAKYKFTDSDVTLNLQMEHTPLFMQAFGYKSIKHNALASAGFGDIQARNVDLVLIADATGSMATTLAGIQDNMRNFTVDLDHELESSNYELGDTRVKFIFYRDYMIDNHKDWTGRTMDPPLATQGAMYESKFYELPSEKLKMDTYVDAHIAEGGGSERESGLEALFHAISSPDWRSAETTIRSIVLWTDASARPLGDKTEIELAPSDVSYWNNEYFKDTMGDAFVALDQADREIYMDSNYYPKDMPSTIEELKSKFENFHQANAKGMSNTSSLYVNQLSYCASLTDCDGWDTHVVNWDGAEIQKNVDTITSSETYDQIVLQVADIIVSQANASDLALSR